MIQKLTTKQTKQSLLEKEQYLLNFLDETNKAGLLSLGKDSITRKYGELAVLTAAELDMML